MSSGSGLGAATEGVVNKGRPAGNSPKKRTVRDQRSSVDLGATQTAAEKVGGRTSLAVHPGAKNVVLRSDDPGRSRRENVTGCALVTLRSAKEPNSMARLTRHVVGGLLAVQCRSFSVCLQCQKRDERLQAGSVGGDRRVNRRLRAS